MTFPLHQSPTAIDFWFRNASEFPSLSVRCLDATCVELCHTLSKKCSECDVIVWVCAEYFY